MLLKYYSYYAGVVTVTTTSTGILLLREVREVLEAVAESYLITKHVFGD